MQVNPQLYPFPTNPTTGEPYLQLPSHKNIVLTPVRRSDIPQLVVGLNIPQVAQGLGTTANPYTEQHAASWLDRLIPPVSQMLQDLEAAKEEPEPIIVSQLPFQAIRLLDEDGQEGNLIGHISIHRFPWMELATPGKVDWDTAEKRKEENLALPAGHPDILWTVGYWILPSYQGKGIMTEAVSTILKMWAVPRMKVEKMLGAIFPGNEASVRVLEKNDFRVRDHFEQYKEIKGKMMGGLVLEWNRPRWETLTKTSS